MQIVSNGDNLHEMSNPVFREIKKKIINLSSAELVKGVVKVMLITTTADNVLISFYFSEKLILDISYESTTICLALYGLT